LLFLRKKELLKRSSAVAKTLIIFFIFTIIAFLSIAFQPVDDPKDYIKRYETKINNFRVQQLALLQYIKKNNLQTAIDLEEIKEQIDLTRNSMKGVDFFLRYLDPLAYKKINGPLPVEWETEVFEKYEKPYKRIGAGLTLAALYLEEPVVEKDSLARLIQSAISATESYQADSTTRPLQAYTHFFLCNRLYLLNLAAIYTTGFECPHTDRVIPELRHMMAEVKDIYLAYAGSFPSTPLPNEYLELYERALLFARDQPNDNSMFDHFTFIKDYINPLFSLNQTYIRRYEVVSASFVDYSLNNEATSIFKKDLYYGQNTKGMFLRVHDDKALVEIDRIGKMLFYDPILSANNSRSCFSCHNSFEYFTDTATATAFQFNHQDFLPRNTPSLINVEYNHLVMLDGKHINLQNQVKEVVSNHMEMGSDRAALLKKILSCADYEKTFKNLLTYTPQEKEVTFDHVASAITFYYSKFSYGYAPFDEAMDQNKPMPPAVTRGFNLFMSKAQCATCHFVPQFNGVKPPFVGSEFEVLGTPADKNFTALSADVGRFGVNPAPEMLHAFRTGSIRNIAHTKPYMHNGVFTSLEEVIDFYNAGGGAGKGLKVENQTLSSDSLHLSAAEKKDLLVFIHALDEKIPFEAPPAKLPTSRTKSLNNRKVGGDY